MEISQKETDRLVAEFFSRGGMITRIESRYPTRPKLQLFKSERYRTVNFNIG